MSLLEVRNLGKAYRVYKSELRRVLSWFGFSFIPVEEHWVLRDINFTVSAGEAIGIVGQNGAGKSSLLKQITGTQRPTEGVIHVNGRIAAILELGMGFNPEFTGRQNARHGLGLMGFSQLEVEKIMPELESFAEVGEYFDQPVRTYSSGMQMRVAFAVVTAYRPEILIIDEAMSVGDTYFQHKSMGRIRDFQKEGTTLLMVSHDREAIQALCGRAILLERGKMIKDGAPEEIFDYYNALIAAKENNKVELTKLDTGKVQTRSGTGEARIEEVALYNSLGELAECINVAEQVEFRIKIKIYEAIETLVLGYGIKDRLGQMMHGTNTWYTEQVISTPEVNGVYEFSIIFSANLGVGSYSVVVALHDQESHLAANYDWRDLALIFNVVNKDKLQFSGCNWIESEIVVKTL